MDIFDGHYYKTSKWFLSVTGLWPYLSKRRRRISEFIFILVNATLIAPQLVLLKQKWIKDFNVTCENTLSIMFSIACYFKYMVTYESSKRLKLLFEQIANDWQSLTDNAEREILKSSTGEGKFIAYASGAWFVYTSMPFLPAVMDIFIPLNESRPLLLPFYANYIFFDQIDYHYWVCLHISAVYFTSLMLFAGVDSTVIITVKHVCGLFTIICRRLENLTSEKQNDSNDIVRNKTISSILSKTVALHNETIRCFEFLEDSFSFTFLILNLMSVFAIALTSVYVLYIMDELYKVIRVLAFLIGLVIHIWYLSYVGQQIIDSSESVYVSTYNSCWYLLSLEARSYIKIIMVRTLYPCEMTAGKITVLSMENFGILMKTSGSYFTVLLSFT